ncbi:hypothetical protein VNO77_33328 [Canavalia gladiata]|uniref:Uncharacterized protein n=1 Tax=Canavalia gladiata TaxID=3824 RepID=A0AAN9KBK3_CANGL
MKILNGLQVFQGRGEWPVDHVWLFDLRINLTGSEWHNLNQQIKSGWNHVEISCSVMNEPKNVTVKCCGIHLYKDRMNINDVSFISPDLHGSHLAHDNINDSLDIYDEAREDVVFPSILAKYFTKNILDFMVNLQSSKEKGDNGYDYGEVLELDGDTDNQDLEEERHSAYIDHQIQRNCELVQNDKGKDTNSSKIFLNPLTETQEPLPTSIHNEKPMLVKKSKWMEKGNLCRSQVPLHQQATMETQLDDQVTSGKQINIGFNKSKQISRTHAKLQYNKSQANILHTQFPQRKDNGQQPVSNAEASKSIVESPLNEDNMEAFYASLKAETASLSLVQDIQPNNVSVKTRPSEETQKWLRILQDLVSKKFSLLLHPERSGLVKDTLNYLLSLPPDEGLSLRTKSVIQQLSLSHAKWSLDYNNANHKLASATADLSKAQKVKNDLESNVKDFQEMDMVEKCLCNQLAILLEEKRDLEVKINAIKAEIADFTVQRDTVAKRKKELFHKGRMMKSERDDLRIQVPRLKADEEWVKMTQTNIEAEWSKLGEQFIAIITAEFDVKCVFVLFPSSTFLFVLAFSSAFSYYFIPNSLIAMQCHESISMEFEEAQRNLRAIRLLYRLLEDNSLVLPNANSEDLVQRARVLLKCLLDVAVESFSETHLKIIATRAGISKTSFDQEKHVALVESESPVSVNISQSFVKYPTCSKMTSEKDEQLQLKLLSMKGLTELSKFSISDDGGTKIKTLCSVGEESSMMQQSSSKATNLYNENGILPNTENSYHHQQHNSVNALYSDGEHTKESLQMLDAKAGEQNEENNISLVNRSHESQSNSNVVECPDQKSDFSEDLVNAIRRIESRILAFQLRSNLLDSTKSSAGRHTMHKVTNSDSSVMNQKTCKSSCKGENSISANAFEEPFCARKESLSQMANQNPWLRTSAESAKSIEIPNPIRTQMVSGGDGLRSRNRIQKNSAQNIATMDRINSLNRLVGGDAYLGSQASECIQGLRVPLNRKDHTRKHSMLASQTNRESFVRKSPVAWSKTRQNRKEKSSQSSYAQKLAVSKSIIARREKPPPHQMVMKPTLLDQRSGENKVNSHQHRDWSVLDWRKTHKIGHLEPLKNRVVPEHHELEESNSNFDSSHWSSQQGSVKSSSDSEDYSLADGTQCPSSGRMVDAANEGSLEENSNSYLHKDNDPSHRFGSIKSYRHGPERNPKKTIGRFRKMKNKLGLIFHHHHHHHHHHHGDDHGNTLSKAGHRHSMWNNLQNAFHHKNKHGVLKKQKVEKTKRGTVARVLTRRNQAGQFHRLVEGVLSHIQHSKKHKPSKLDGVKRSRNTPHGNSLKKKLHWWQILPRHQGVKLKNKGRVKMGFITQKSLKN